MGRLEKSATKLGMKSTRAITKTHYHDRGVRGVATTQVCRKVFAKRSGISSAGTKYEKGDVILHMGSTRRTGEVFVLAEGDLEYFMDASPRGMVPMNEIEEKLEGMGITYYPK